MSLLLRFAFFLTLAGFALGLLLRRVRPERTPEAVALAALPWAVHLVYALVWAIATHGAVLGSVVFGLLNIAMGAAVLRFGSRLYRRDARRAGGKRGDGQAARAARHAQRRGGTGAGPHRV